MDNWFDRVKGLEDSPSAASAARSASTCASSAPRCTRTSTASTITSSLGISRWKDMNQINGCGERAAARYDDLVY